MSLTPKQEKFAQLVAWDGLSQTVAYRQVYATGNMKPETVWNNAYVLMQHNDVSARVAELRQPLEAQAVVSTNETLTILKGIAENGRRDSDRIAACDKILKTLGAYRGNSRDHDKPGPVTHVTVVLASGTSETLEVQAPHVVDSECQVLPEDSAN